MRKILLGAVVVVALTGSVAAQAADEAEVTRLCEALPILRPDKIFPDDKQLGAVLCSLTIIIATAQLKGQPSEDCEKARQVVYEEAQRRGISEAARLACKDRMDKLKSGKP
jgi:hypothetical protein